MSQEELVVLVDAQDNVLGTMEKMQAHQTGSLHRAFSVFIVREHNGAIECLLQQRAAGKYHSPNLWTNTCCSHQRLNEDTLAAAHRRLQEEVRLTANLECAGSFIYQATFANGLTEHELDHIVIGQLDPAEQDLIPNPDEAQALQWMSFTQLENELKSAPNKFTAWLPIAMNALKKSKPEWF